MEENKLEQCLKVLDDRWEDVDTYIGSIPDGEIRSALSFLVRDGVDELKSEVSRLKDEVFLYEVSNDSKEDLKEDIEDLEGEIDDLKDEISELEKEVEELRTSIAKEETLDWEIAMNTFWKLRDRMNPWEFEKLIKERYD